jgi:hypothetical protein
MANFCAEILIEKLPKSLIDKLDIRKVE